MCDTCFCTPCHPRCPNAPECKEEPVITCDVCGKFVYDGDVYYDIDGDFWCEECIERNRKTA